MDLISQLSSTLGLSPEKTQALAGTVLGAVKSQAGGDADAISEAVPELETWSAKAEGLTEPTGMGGLLGSAIGAIGGQGAQEAAGVAAALSKLGLDSSKAALVAPVVINFLTERLSPDVLQRVLSAAPMLSGLVQDKDGDGLDIGDALGALGSLFGR
ncbi:MAG: hypothetical protein ACI8RZ_004760 [Myxococcota bacterium]|jgi:hypothetical protein